MVKTFYTTLLILPFIFFSCSEDNKLDIDEDSNPPSNKSLHVTYKVTSNYPKETDLMVSFNDSEGNYIVKTVSSGWTYEAKLPKGKKAFLSSVVSSIKNEYLGEIDITDCETTAQIIQDGKIVKEAVGLSVVVELE